MTFHEVLAARRLLPLVAPTSVDEAQAAATTVGGGLLEVALRRPGALEALRAVAGTGGLLVGAGTVLTAAQVDAAVEAGARFIVTPGLSAAVVVRCRELGVPVLPGVSSATEVMAALDLGIDVVKLFPAALLGGPAMADALAGPFPDVRLVPSGGVGADVAHDYLARPNVVAVSRSVR